MKFKIGDLVWVTWHPNTGHGPDPTPWIGTVVRVLSESYSVVNADGATEYVLEDEMEHIPRIIDSRYDFSDLLGGK